MRQKKNRKAKRRRFVTSDADGCCTECVAGSLCAGVRAKQQEEHHSSSHSWTSGGPCRSINRPEWKALTAGRLASTRPAGWNADVWMCDCLCWCVWVTYKMIQRERHGARWRRWWIKSVQMWKVCTIIHCVFVWAVIITKVKSFLLHIGICENSNLTKYSLLLNWLKQIKYGFLKHKLPPIFQFKMCFCLK